MLIDMKSSLAALLCVFITLNTSLLFAQVDISRLSVASSANTAGFSYTKNSAATSAAPVIFYQQLIEMLSTTDDMPSLKVYGNGHVLVHIPVYMKNAGDYEMDFDDTRMVNLIQSLSTDGILDFDEQKTADKVNASEKNLRAKGQFHTISDAVYSIVDIKLDEYQKSSSSKKQTGFHKRFQWKNIEHDARRHHQISEITNAGIAISQLQALLHDARLVRK